MENDQNNEIAYETFAKKELESWQKKMLARPTIINVLSKKLQTKINSWIPEKVHKIITTTIKQMIRGVLFGAQKITKVPLIGADLFTRELDVTKTIESYKKTAATEGAITGAGGILLGLADFPILLSIKLKLLFDIASIYGFDTNDYRERIYLLHIFELAFSSAQHRKSVYLSMVDWDALANELPEDINQFDWRSLQQEYRDYLDIAKMAQLLPVVGAPVGLIVNYRLIKKLGITAMNAYRMRIL